jgi:hypothetical protein
VRADPRQLGLRGLLASALFASPSPVFALDVRVDEVRAVAATVRAAIELRDAFPERFRKLIEEGGTLYVRIESELWEDRPAWDRLVGPTAIAGFRVDKGADAGSVAVLDGFGTATPYKKYPQPLPLRVDVGRTERIVEDARYYVNIVATIGTIAEREIEGVGDAVFGRESEEAGLRTLGRFLFRKVLQLSDYLQSITAQTTSRKIPGKQIAGR